MLRNSQHQEKDVKKSQKENAEIAIERARTKDIQKLKSLDDLMKEKS